MLIFTSVFLTCNLEKLVIYITKTSFIYQQSNQSFMILIFLNEAVNPPHLHLNIQAKLIKLKITGARLWRLLPARALRARIPDPEPRGAAVPAPKPAQQRRGAAQAAAAGAPRPPRPGPQQGRGDVRVARPVAARLRGALLRRHLRRQGARQDRRPAEEVRRSESIAGEPIDISIIFLIIFQC